MLRTVGRPEGIDRLGVVAHHGQPLALGREQVKDLGLQGVGVLILVDQHAIELLADRRPGLRIGQQGVPVEQQVVVVQHGGGLLAIHVAVQQPLQLVGPIATPGELAGERLLQLLAGVDAAAVDGHAGPLLGEPLVGLGQAQLGADDVQQVLGIGAVVDGEIGRQADGLAVAAQQPRGDGMKSAAPDLRAARRGTTATADGLRPDAAAGYRRGGAFRPPPGG